MQFPNHGGRIGAWARWMLVLGFLGFPLFAGCGSDRPETTPVGGIVTWDGRPVTEGRIMFYPENGRAATGQIGSDGTYSLTTFKPNDGAMLGKHRVTIKAVSVVGGTPQPRSFQEELAQGRSGGQAPVTPGTVKWLVPKEYSQVDTTPLTAEVSPGKNTVDFNLPTAVR